ncbi:MAG: hypothetical protein AAF806_26085, partial [Bacteroidota bacterium]
MCRIAYLFMLLLSIAACSQEQLNHSEKGNELTALRYDSVFYNVHLGITYQQFLENCWKNHQQQFFYPNEKGTAVTFELTEGFSSSV